MHETPGSQRVVLLAGGDLLARARMENATSQMGARLEIAQAKDIRETLKQAKPDILVLDLDDGGTPVLEELMAARAEGDAPERVVGYFSHVDDALREEARAAGCRAVPRGRFWTNLTNILQGAGV
jgi:DNA-binding NarL/FixJ family response regulator